MRVPVCVLHVAWLLVCCLLSSMWHGEGHTPAGLGAVLLDFDSVYHFLRLPHKSHTATIHTYCTDTQHTLSTATLHDIATIFWFLQLAWLASCWNSCWSSPLMWYVMIETWMNEDLWFLSLDLEGVYNRMTCSHSLAAGPSFSQGTSNLNDTPRSTGWTITPPATIRNTRAHFRLYIQWDQQAGSDMMRASASCALYRWQWWCHNVMIVCWELGGSAGDMK